MTDEINLPDDFNVENFVYVAKQGERYKKQQYAEKVSKYLESLTTSEQRVKVQRLIDERNQQIEKEKSARHRKTYTLNKRCFSKQDKSILGEVLVELVSTINILIEKLLIDKISPALVVEATSDDVNAESPLLPTLVQKLKSNETKYREVLLTKKCKTYLETFYSDTRKRKRAVSVVTS